MARIGKQRLRKRLLRQAVIRYGASESGEIDFYFDDYALYGDPDFYCGNCSFVEDL